MKIGQLDEHCGNCPLIDYCTEPYETPQLCIYEELEEVSVEKYKQIARNISEEEIQDKIRQYEKNDFFPWSHERNGAIYDIVLEKLDRNDSLSQA